MASELIGPAEIARRLGVTPGAVSHWIKRSARGAVSPLRPSFPSPRQVSNTTRLWSWADVMRWGARWQQYHPGALPGLPLEQDAEPLDEAEGNVASLRVITGGCRCPGNGVISMNCPIHT